MDPDVRDSGNATATPAQSQANTDPMPTPPGIETNGTSPIAKGEPCPECGGLLVPESGCWYCVHCGYSRCG